MKIYKYLLMLSLALMAVSCSDENKEMVDEEVSSNQLKNLTGSDFWTPGETIYYCYMNGTAKEQDIVEECMNLWMGFANIKFEECPRRYSQVRIYFENGVVNTASPVDSKCGKRHNINEPKETWTMRINKENIHNESELRGAIMHSLGHVLGFTDNIARESDTRLPDFDAKSLMNFHIPGNYWGYTHNLFLSEKDIEQVKRVYPYPASVVPIFVASDEKTPGLVARADQIQDKTKIRKFIGLGITNYGAGAAGCRGRKLCKCVNKKTGEVRYGIQTIKGITADYGNGIGNGSGWDIIYVTYVETSMGYGRTPISMYYTDYTNQYGGISYTNDPFMKSRGLHEVGLYAVLLSEPE